ncbi:ankyrin repeats (3 copies) domain-containing protein [Trichoderma breve]|uniref:Ankyrin repeats (3 copies) domain-containing protein n=1 Tax=Trichoderma breve TaxID=2034170 RepID=A0A9W9B2A3_9HYPO|nr:ankyrin repeats (3 copies) domain-containing protein [Trichoderma breve]KAJ4854228.1 ankyrin repeats (3 copies) domain-containing protein [Trichoderma breve]
MIAEKHCANEYITQEDLDFGLCYATYGGHLDIVQLFLVKGANINAHCGRWDSAVHAAVRGGHMNILELFVSKGADVNSQPPLFVCISRWDTQCLKYLLDHGMNIDIQDTQRGTALHKAIADWHYAHFDLLLERGADINALSEKLGTPLQVACLRAEEHNNRYEPHKLYYVEKLLDCGADPNIRGGEYATALQAACNIISLGEMEFPIKAVQLLIEHGADVNAQGGHWGSALHAAAASRFSEEKVELMKLLLDNGAKVDQKGNDNWGTPLHVACYEGTIEAVRLLVDRGADVNAEGGRFGTPILAAAARQDSLPIFNLLMDKGANINYQGGEYGSALQAFFHRFPQEAETFRSLLKHCLDVNAKGGKYGTALIAACTRDWGEKCVRLLLDHGADVNAQSEEYGTALIAACQSHFDEGNTQIIRWLLDCGADVNAQGGKHGTALSAACSCDYYEAVELLLNHGAKFHLQDCAAWYSVIRRIATHRCVTAVLELLLSHGMDINHEHAEYGTALHAMMKEKQTGSKWHEGISVLLKHHMNPNIVNERLGSALHIACAIKHEDVHADFIIDCMNCTDISISSRRTEYLLEQCPNIDVNAQGGTFHTALQAAAYSGQALSVRMLLDRNASINARGGKYHTALNGAIISGHWNIVKILLEAGATPDCHLQEQPDEDWLQIFFKEDGRRAVERYRKFWEVELGKQGGRRRASNS